MNIIELLRRPNPSNPRKIHPQDLDKLRKSLATFGDLGGIVVNKRTGWLVSGHQRMTAIGDDVVLIVTGKHRMKIVINNCYGGFSISRKAAEFMAARGNERARLELEQSVERFYVTGIVTGKQIGRAHV